MSSNGKGSIVLKILIVLMALVLIFILTVPPKLWYEQSSAIRNERRGMSSIAEAEKFYKRVKGMYTLDFDSIHYQIGLDTSLTDRRRLSEASQGLFFSLQRSLNNDIITHLIEVSENYRQMVEDFEDPEKIAVLNRSIPGKEDKREELLRVADSLYNALNSLPLRREYTDVTATARMAKEIDILAKNIADERLAEALLKSATITDSLEVLLENFDATKALEYFTQVSAPLVNEFADRFFELELQQRSPFAERTISFQAQIEYNLTAIANMDYQRALSDYMTTASMMEGLYNSYLVEYSDLLDNYASLFLSTEDSLLIEFNPNSMNSVMMPGEKFIVEFDSSFTNIAIESPVLLETAKENVSNIKSSVKGLGLIEQYSNLQKILDTLNVNIEKNLAELRNEINYRQDRMLVRSLTLELKTLPLVANNFKETPVIKYGFEQLTALEEMSNETRFSKIQSGLENTARLMSYYTSIVDSNKVDIVGSVMDALMHDAAKADTMFYDLKFRRSNPDWISLRETLEPGYDALQNIVSSIKSEHQSYMTISEQAFDAFQLNSEGLTEYHYGIFPVSIQNTGYIENGNASWEEE